MTSNDKLDGYHASLTHRIAAEIADSFDEELEMELDDGPLDEVIAAHGDHPSQSECRPAPLFQGAVQAAEPSL